MTDAWIVALPDDVFADALGPSWFTMTERQREAYGAPDDATPARPQLAALPLWQAEVHAGRRIVRDRDALAHAAGYEASALDAWKDGLYAAGLRDFQEADAVIEQAARKRGAA